MSSPKKYIPAVARSTRKQEPQTWNHIWRDESRNQQVRKKNNALKFKLKSYLKSFSGTDQTMDFLMTIMIWHFQYEGKVVIRQKKP